MNPAAAALFGIFILTAGATHHAAAVASHHYDRAPTSSVRAPAEPPSQGMDCSLVVIDTADCIMYLSEGSNETKPEKTCCQGLVEVLNTNASCLCYALENSVDLGIDVNMTRASTLASDCHVHAPPISKCGSISRSPGEASASPGHTPIHRHHQTPAPAPHKLPASAPRPSKSGAAATGLVSSLFISSIMMAMVATCLT